MSVLATNQPHSSCRHHGLVVDEATREVFLSGELIILTRTEFDLLVILQRNPRRVLTPDVLLMHLWNSPFVDHGHPIEVYIHRLRKKLGESGRTARYIHTVRGVGYRFEPDAFDSGHIQLTYDGTGTLKDVQPSMQQLWGRNTSEILGTLFDPVAAVSAWISEHDGCPETVRWEIHVSRSSTSST